MFLLFLWMAGSMIVIGGALFPTASIWLLPLLGLGCLGLLIAALVLAIIGLVEIRDQKSVYTQGKKQAIWSLIFVGLFGALMIAGFVRGLTMKKSQPADGKLRSAKFNLEYTIPDRSWVSVDAKRINTNAVFALMHSRPSGLFMIVAEDPGVESELTLDALVENVKATAESTSADYRLISEKDLQLKGMKGKLLELEFENLNRRYFSLQTVFYHNGYVYQLLARGPVGDRDFVKKEASRLFEGFGLIDGKNLAHISRGKLAEHHASPFGYEVNLKGVGWHEWSASGKEKMSGEFGVLYKKTGALTVAPLLLEGTNPQWDAIVSAALERLDIEVADEKLGVLTSPVGIATNSYFSYERTVDNTPFVYRLLVTRNQQCAYLVASWHAEGDTEIEKGFLDDAINRVTFMPEGRFTLPVAKELSRHRKEVQSLFFNDLGLFHYKENAYEKGLLYFRLAQGLIPQNKTFTQNIIEACKHLKQYDKALEALEQAKNVYQKNQWHVERAYLLAQAERKDEAIENFKTAFSDQYNNDDYFVEYLDLLMERDDFDAGLKEVERYLAHKDSPRIRLWQAAFLREKKQFDKSIAILREQQAKYPSNKDLSFNLWETYHAAERDADALEICEGLLKKGVDSARLYYLKGRSEMALKHYREAKSSFEIALKKSPADSDIKDFLDHVSGMLGEGDNSMIKTVIAAVPIPENILKELPTEPASTGEHPARYLRTIDAISFEKGKEQKMTQVATVKVYNSAGVSQFSSLEFSFDPLSEDIFVNELTVKNKQGNVIWSGKPSDYYVLDQGGEMAHQKKTLHVPISGLQAGYTIDWTVTRRDVGRPKAFDYSHRTFSRFYPVTKGTVLLRGDIASVKWQTSSNVIQKKIDGTICWQVDSPAIYRYESLQPSSFTYLPSVSMSDAAGTWEGEAKDYLKSIEEKFVLDSTTQALAEKQVVGAATVGEKVGRLAQFVQTNITYKAIEFGRRASIPNAADKVIENRYGDCKDHSLLLRQMLKAVGIDSHLALVNSADPVERELPTRDQFDHMILYVPGLGTGTFLDCTAKDIDAATAALASTPNTFALVLDPANPRLVTIPLYPTNASTTSVEREISVENNSDIVMREKIQLTGYNASYYRSILKDEEPSRWKGAVQKEYAEMNRATVVESVKASDVTDFKKPLLLEISSRVKNVFHEVNGSLSGKVPVGWELLYINAEPLDKRETPMQVRFAQTIRSSTTIHSPQGYRLLVTPLLNQEPQSIFARAKTSTQTVSTTATEWKYEFHRFTNTYPASAYAAYDQALSKISQIIQPDFIFEKRK